MYLFNSLSKSVEMLFPIEPGKITLYVCGLTPYDSTHIGHARTYVSFDVLKRYLIKKGYKVYHIQNITDVEDKIIKRCMETGADPKTLTEQNHSEALELFGKLHIIPADVYPAVTSHMREIIDFIELLIKNKSAYETKTGVYFSVSTSKNYGLLSGQNLCEIEDGARVEVDETKKDPADFALWKKSKGEIMEFDSPWGRGRPGWHIECSAISRAYSKRTLDIHGGARDLIFPHHENEITQSEAAYPEKFSNLWVHTGFLTVSGEKMSKSLGNFITLNQALKHSSPNALRLFYLQAHYRSPLDYDEENLNSMEEAVERIFNSLGLITEVLEKPQTKHTDPEFRKKTEELISLFYKNLDDDLKTPEAIASLFGLFRLINSHISRGKKDSEQLLKIHNEIKEMLWMLGLVEEKKGLTDKEAGISLLAKEFGIDGSSLEEILNLLISLRDQARANKDYNKSDRIRKRLSEIGIIIEDKPGSTRWKIQ